MCEDFETKSKGTAPSLSTRPDIIIVVKKSEWLKDDWENKILLRTPRLHNVSGATK